MMSELKRNYNNLYMRILRIQFGMGKNLGNVTTRREDKAIYTLQMVLNPRLLLP